MTQADKGTRAGNFIIDSIIVIIIIVLVALSISLFYPGISDGNSPAFELLASITYFSYYFFWEHFFSKTPGKMLTQTFVVDRNGNKPGVLNLLARTLVRLIPIEGISFLFGHLGLHDLVSGTRVVKNDSQKKQQTEQ